MELRLPEEDLIRQLMTSSQCEVCGKLYEEDNVSIIGHDADMCVLQVCCGACHSQSLLVALFGANNDTESVPLTNLSDLTEFETRKFENVIITVDDVLDMSNYLMGFKGNCSHLFE
jgi:hypothetical protein